MVAGNGLISSLMGLIQGQEQLEVVEDHFRSRYG